MLLEDGRLTFDGDTKAAVAQYLNTYPQGESGHIAGVFDLAVADRSGAGYEPVLKRLELRPRGGGPSDTIRMGERLQVEIAVEGFDEIPRAMVEVTVGSSMSQCLFRMTTRMIPLGATNPRQSGEIIFLDVASLPLTPGNYYMNVNVFGEAATLVDKVNRAAEFIVLPADVLGTGYEFSSRDGPFTVEWDWELRPETADT